MAKHKLPLIVFGVMGLIGILLCAAAYYNWKVNHDLKTKGIATRGKVVGYRSQTSYSSSSKRRQSSQTYAAVVAFVDVNHQPQTAASDVYTSPPRFDVGEQINLWYDPENPERILIEGAEEWLISTILGSVGALLALAGVSNFFKTIGLLFRAKAVSF